MMMIKVSMSNFVQAYDVDDDDDDDDDDDEDEYAQLCSGTQPHQPSAF